MYGKIENGKLIYFKPPLVDGEWQTFNPSEEMLRDAGWKPVVDTPYPEDTQYKYVGRWEEQTNQIVKAWDSVEWTEEEKTERYHALAQQYIHERYSYDDENKIMREYSFDQEAYADEFNAYYAFVEQAKRRAYTEVYGYEG
jgi:hypothetical protein